MKTILIVDDERDIVDMLKYNVQKEGYSVLTASNGIDAVELAKQKPDLILLDIMMPGYDGLEVLKQLRADEILEKIPVVFLTARGSDVDEVVGFELGADDYIVKPISIPKLMARIKNTLRKRPPMAVSPEVNKPVRVGPIEIYKAQHEVKVHNKKIFLPRKEFEVLLYLAERAGQVINRAALLDAIWGSDVQVVDRTVDVHIRKIREKLGKSADYIETIKGVGYKMKEHE
jgi:two-component system alkaline phosphatase synthesis response regulator PhoP